MGEHLSKLRLSRRAMIASVASLPIAPRLVAAQGAAGGSTGFVIRERDPLNLESDFSTLDSFITPTNKFFVRSHFAVPQIDLKSWRLKVEGAVQHPLEISFDELRRMPTETKPVTLECAGNGRVLLVPKVDGAQWQFGAVGNAEWTGVPLNSLLERAGVDPKTTDVVLEGADAGDASKPSRPAKPLHFARSVSTEQARNGGILLAYKMNGQDLPDSHGFPVRAIVPGWYGMASVKWLSRIVVMTEAFQGYFQTVDYAYWQERNGLPVRVPLNEQQVKSQIARPTFGEIVARGTPYRVFGASWSGNSPISKVEISIDNGKTFAAATLLGQDAKHAWRLWEYKWNVPPAPGKAALQVKATDARGNTQPLERDKNRENYMINHVIPVEVQVR